jgi:hypothetical protein
MWQIEGSNLAIPKLGTPTDMPNLKLTSTNDAQQVNNYLLNMT